MGGKQYRDSVPSAYWEEKEEARAGGHEDMVVNGRDEDFRSAQKTERAYKLIRI